MSKYTITDSHSLTATAPFSAEILAATKLKVTNAKGSCVVPINPANGGVRQRHVVKGQGAPLFALLLGVSKATPTEVEIEVAE